MHTTSTPLTCTGSPNFREIGCSQGSEDPKLKRGILYRSGELSALTVEDIDLIRCLGIKTIVDLRTPKERRSKPDLIGATQGVENIHLPIYPSKDDPGAVANFLTITKRSIDWDSSITTFYNRVAFEHHRDIGTIITLIATAEKLPLLIHCTAGKDRTGILSALIQLAAGVPRADVLHDYAITNDRLRQFKIDMLRKYRWLKLFRVKFEQMDPLFGVQEKYLNTLIEKIISEFGTLDAYFVQKCGVDSKTVQAFHRSIT